MSSIIHYVVGSWSVAVSVLYWIGWNLVQVSMQGLLVGHRVLFWAGAVLVGPVIAICLVVGELSLQLQGVSDGSPATWFQVVLGFSSIWC